MLLPELAPADFQRLPRFLRAGPSTSLDEWKGSAVPSQTILEKFYHILMTEVRGRIGSN